MEELLEHLCTELSLCGVPSSSQIALLKAPQVNISFRITGMCGQRRRDNTNLDKEQLI